MPPFKHYKAGLQNVGSYQVSGRPWITGSLTLGIGEEHQIEFPKVAKSVTVINTDAGGDDIRVHFNTSSAPGNVISGLHYVPLNENRDSVSINCKCKEIYISAPSTNAATAAYCVVAELTSISTENMYTLTGSGLTT